MKTRVYHRSDGKWAWRIVAPNGEIVATDGGQGYENMQDAVDMVTFLVSGDYETVIEVAE